MSITVFNVLYVDLIYMLNFLNIRLAKKYGPKAIQQAVGEHG